MSVFEWDRVDGSAKRNYKGRDLSLPASDGRALFSWALVRSGEQDQVEHRCERPSGGNDARHAIEIEVMPRLPKRKRGREIGIGRRKIDDRRRRQQREPGERHL